MARQNKLRVGILTHNYPITSKERKDAGIFIYDFAHELARKNKVFVFCPDFGGKKEKYKKVPVTWFKWDSKNEKFGNWKLYNPIYIYKFFKLIYVGQREAVKFAEKNNLDCCLACWTLPSAVFAWQIKRKLGTPYAAWSLGSDVNKYVRIPILGQFISMSLKSADKLFANSYALSQKVKKITGRDCDFMPAITNFELKKISQPKINKKVFNFLFVGRLEKVKGPDILIDAVTFLAKKNKKFKLNVLGGGSMMDELKSRADENFVGFVGWADEAVVGGYMSMCDCLVVSSRSESLPLVIIEAAKVGLPVIATDVGDCRRIVRDYNIGEVVAKEDLKELARAMEKVLKRGKRFKRGYQKGLRNMTDDFQQKKAVQIFLK